MNIRSRLVQGLSAVALAASASCGSTSSSVPADPICDATFQMAQRFSLPWDGRALNLGLGPFMISQSALLDPYTNELVTEMPNGCEYVDDRCGGQYGFHEPLPLELVCCENTVHVRANFGYITEVATRHVGMRTDNGLVIGGSAAEFERVYPNALRSTSSPYDIRISEHVKVLVKEGVVESLATSSYQFFNETAFGEPSIPPGPENTSDAWYEG